MENDYYRHIRNRCVINDSGFYAEILMRVLPHTHEYKYAMDALKGGNILAKKECTDHLGNMYSSIGDMCNTYGIKISTFYSRLQRGYTLQDALTERRWNHCCCDHNGKQYPSFEDMCLYYNQGKKLVINRLHNGWSLEDALTIPKRQRFNENSPKNKKKKMCIDHENRCFKNMTQMCKYWGVTRELYKDRIRRGWTIKDALTIPKGEYSPTFIESTDHTGRKFKTFSDMCKAYDISTNTVKDRLRRGWNLKIALTTPPARKIVPCKDHLNIEYRCLSDMCAAYNISLSLYYNRLSLGYDLEDILTLPLNHHFGRPTDHLGQKFETYEDMCTYWGITVSLWRERIKNGWTLEETLTLPLGEKHSYWKESVDHLGITYKNFAEMCRAYGFKNENIVKSRLSHGWTLEEALTLPLKMYIGEYRVAECLKRLNVKFYHDCSIKTVFKDLAFDINWNEFLDMLHQNLGNAGINWSKSKIEKLRPDFVLYTDENNKIRGVIEFDGEQHQNFVEFFFKTIEEFIRRSNTDFVKQSLWEYLDIPMLRIRHDQVDMIDDMVKDFIDNPQNYIHNHNTYLSEDEYWSILSEEKAKLELAFAS